VKRVEEGERAVRHRVRWVKVEHPEKMSLKRETIGEGTASEASKRMSAKRAELIEVP